MPKKTITIPLTELRRDDLVKQTGLVLPKQTSRNPFLDERQPYSPYGIDTVQAVAVERLVDEKLAVYHQVSEGAPIDIAIKIVISEYEYKNGDLKRMRITTEVDFGSYGNPIVVRLEGWIR